MADVEEMLNMALKDPVSQILRKYSRITVIQYETLLIDLFTRFYHEDAVKIPDKISLRSKKTSRGSYYRTLVQARRNVISSIYTILLLSYLGIFDFEVFDHYKNLAERLRDYSNLVSSRDAESEKILGTMEKELMEGLSKWSKPRVLGKM